MALANNEATDINRMVVPKLLKGFTLDVETDSYEGIATPQALWQAYMKHLAYYLRDFISLNFKGIRQEEIPGLRFSEEHEGEKYPHIAITASGAYGEDVYGEYDLGYLTISQFGELCHTHEIDADSGLTFIKSRHHFRGLMLDLMVEQRAERVLKEAGLLASPA